MAPTWLERKSFATICRGYFMQICLAAVYKGEDLPKNFQKKLSIGLLCFAREKLTLTN